MSEEAASAAEELSAQAEALRNVVGQLISTVEGESSANAATASSQAKSASAQERTNVVAISAPTRAASKPVMKKVASGESLATPSRSDKGFEDV